MVSGSGPSATRLTPTQWCRIKGLQVLDPDGWDRRNLAVDWHVAITEAEFDLKASVSTVRLLPPLGSARSERP